MMHVYLSIKCKTPGCNTSVPVKYFGPDIGAVEISESTPTGFVLECGECHKQHRYEIADLFIQKLPFAPPPGWQNGWE